MNGDNGISDIKNKNFIDRMVIYLCENCLYYLAAGMMLLCSVLIRIYLAKFKFNGDYISGDFLNYLRPWVEQYRDLGFAGGLRAGISNYYVPYNLFLGMIAVLNLDEGIWISVISCIGEYISVIFIYKILVFILETRTDSIIKKVNKRALFTALMILYFPFCMLNGTLWKQCDGWYTSFIFIGLYFLIQKKYHRAFAFLSIAFVFKLQTLFLVPFLLILYMLYYDFSILEFLWFPGMYLVAGLPAIACGRSVIRTYSTYLKQATVYKMTVGFPNIYCFGIDNWEAMAKPAILICITVFVIAACFFKARSRYVTLSLYPVMAGWLVMTCPMFLPAMHSRYDYLALLLISIYALAIDIKMAPAALIMNVVSTFTYGSYLFHMGDNLVTYQTLALMYLFAYLYTAYYLYRKLSPRGEASAGSFTRNL